MMTKKAGLTQVLVVLLVTCSEAVPTAVVYCQLVPRVNPEPGEWMTKSRASGAWTGGQSCQKPHSNSQSCSTDAG